MKYSQFRDAAARNDRRSNDKAHFFARHFQVPVAFVCYKLGLSPNAVTALFGVTGLSSAYFIISDHMLIAYALWRIHIILDMADGSVARATKNFSRLATGFDKCNHTIINTTVLLAPLYYYNSIMIGNALLVTFYLYYYFDLLFTTNRKYTRDFSIPKNIVKNVLGLEGYIILVMVSDFVEFIHIEYVCILYTISFLTMFVGKLRVHYFALQ